MLNYINNGLDSYGNDWQSKFTGTVKNGFPAFVGTNLIVS